MIEKLLSPEELRYRAERARELLKDTLLLEVLSDMRTEALEEMATLSLDHEIGKLREAQAMVAAADAVLSFLESYITASGVRDGGFKPN